MLSMIKDLVIQQVMLMEIPLRKFLNDTMLLTSQSLTSLKLLIMTLLSQLIKLLSSLSTKKAFRNKSLESVQAIQFIWESDVDAAKEGKLIEQLAIS